MLLGFLIVLSAILAVATVCFSLYVLTCRSVAVSSAYVYGVTRWVGVEKSGVELLPAPAAEQPELWPLGSARGGTLCLKEGGWWRGDSSLNVSASVCRSLPTSSLSTECWVWAFQALTPVWLSLKFIFNTPLLVLHIFFPRKKIEQACYRCTINTLRECFHMRAQNRICHLPFFSL